MRTASALLASFELSYGDKIESYTLHFFFADNRRRDKDNFTARMKPVLDGISDAIGHDDSEWEFNGVRFYVDKSNPRVEVRVIISQKK